MQKRSIALISTYDHPTRDSVESMLRSTFPEFELQNFSAVSIIKRNRRWLLPNLRWMASEYSRKLLHAPAEWKSSYLQTSYVVRKLHQHMRTELNSRRHIFSFQTQSMYDTSVPGIPHYIYTDHTHLSNLSSVYFDRRQLRSDAWRALERQAYYNASCVFTRSNDVTEDLTRLYGVPASQVLCVYAGTNVKAIGPLARGSDSYAGRHIIFVGDDWERKGGPQLVDAFEQILKDMPDARLTIIGASPKLRLPNITVLGNLPLDQVAKHYAQASVFCLPTRLEPFGIAFLEAMAHSLPVVGTRVGAVTDIVEDGVSGICVNPDDTAQLKRALQSLLSDPRRCARLGQAGFERLATRYNWKAVGVRIRERILRDLSIAG